MPPNVYTSYLAVTLVVHGLAISASGCDTSWIRLVYMISCGKKKRESTFQTNSTFSDELPRDVEGVVEYLKARNHPALHEEELFLQQILQQSENKPNRFIDPRVRSIETSSNMINKNTVKKQFSEEKPSFLGIPGFPDEWDLEEVQAEKLNINYRREISHLMEQCCQIPPISECNIDTFQGACK